VEAFRSTLEEVGDADIIVHVVDAAHPDPAGQLKTVRDVLGEIGARDIPEMVVFNKADLVDDDTRLVLRGLEPGAFFASSRTGEGVAELRAAIEAALPLPAVEIRAVVPYDRGDLIAAVHESGHVVSLEHGADGTELHAFVGERLAARLAPFAA
jgi:GTP-binding protein HflX